MEWHNPQVRSATYNVMRFWLRCGSEPIYCGTWYGYRWYRVGGLDYLLKRSDIDEQDAS